MNHDGLTPELLSVSGLFDQQAHYTIPIYQRNYAWGFEQIEQLILDIQDAAQADEPGYFLGNLVVMRRGDAQEFEVVDGQQRLTTLYLLLSCLELSTLVRADQHRGRLQYASRARATLTLRQIDQAGRIPHTTDVNEAALEDAGILEGLRTIEQILERPGLCEKPARERFTDFLRHKVQLVRSALPAGTDLTRYFEIMNTRGQQLLQVDIIKARLMSALSTEAERATFAWIWDACADLDSYVQMSLARSDTELRTQIFGPDWSWLQLHSFEALRELCPASGFAGADAPAAAGLSLDAALQQYARQPAATASAEGQSQRFRSTLEFSTFLLHVLKVHQRGAGEDEGQLDDKRLVQSFAQALAQGEKAPWVQGFALCLLRCRNLFDSFLLKRQFTARTQSEDGDWSLQRLQRASGKPAPRYLHSFSPSAPPGDEDEAPADTGTQQVLLLQSLLRVTYTSPRSMHWITQSLQWLHGFEHPGQITSQALASLLQRYARQKVMQAFLAPEEQPTGFGIARIVFNYLDYLLVQQDPMPGFQFHFRNSIEHFYPQNPATDQHSTGGVVTLKHLHQLGNLALVSISTNSKFSNSLPQVKASSFPELVDKQSPKLRHMAQITREQGGWSDAQVQAHHAKVEALLHRDLAALEAPGLVPRQVDAPAEPAASIALT